MSTLRLPYRSRLGRSSILNLDLHKKARNPLTQRRQNRGQVLHKNENENTSGTRQSALCQLRLVKLYRVQGGIDAPRSSAPKTRFPLPLPSKATYQPGPPRSTLFVPKYRSEHRAPTALYALSWIYYGPLQISSTVKPYAQLRTSRYRR